MSNHSKSSNQKQTRAVSNKGEPPKESTSRHVWIEAGVEVELAKHLRDQYAKNRREDGANQRKQFVATVVGSLLIAVYTAVAIWQACLMRKTITKSDEHFRIDERPYVWTSNVTNPKDVSIKAGQRMWINLHLLNFGKAPALRVRGTAWIFIGQGALRDADNWFAAYGEKELPESQNDAGLVIPPGIPSGDVTEKSAFGGGGFFTVMSGKVLTQNDVDYILHSDEKTAIVAHIQYYDAYGNRYWSNICMSRFAAGTYPNCDRHNEIH